MFDYNKLDVVDCLTRLGIKKGDNLFSHSNVAFFGIPDGGISHRSIYQNLIKGILDVIGTDGCLFVPAYTYSFPNKKIFNPKSPISQGGTLAQILINNKKSKRSLEPNVSVVGIGKNSEYFLNNIGTNAYGKKSFFHRFFCESGKICNLNLNSVSTFIHYFERRLKVSYRYDKTFQGKILINNKQIESRSTIFVRKLKNQNFIQDLDYFDKNIKKQKIYKSRKLGRGFIGVMDLKEMFAFISREYEKNNYFLTKLGN